MLLCLCPAGVLVVGEVSRPVRGGSGRERILNRSHRRETLQALSGQRRDDLAPLPPGGVVSGVISRPAPWPRLPLVFSGLS